MEFSVVFFKRLLLAFLVALIVAPCVVAVCLGVSASRAHKMVAELQGQLAAIDRNIELIEQGESVAVMGPDPDLPYQSLYPDLYCESYAPELWVRAENTAYLTFDDGPSTNTEDILAILREDDIQATFFVTASGDNATADLLRRMVDEGHTLAIHTYSHAYTEIYASIEAYLEDFERIYQWIYEATGQKAELFRFPGGSINGYNSAIYQPLVAEMTRRGFTYFDWNVSGEDATKGATQESVTAAVLDDISGTYRAVILLHDAGDKDYTVRALPELIAGIQSKGFSFAPLTAQIKPVVYSYND